MQRQEAVLTTELQELTTELRNIGVQLQSYRTPEVVAGAVILQRLDDVRSDINGHVEALIDEIRRDAINLFAPSGKTCKEAILS